MSPLRSSAGPAVCTNGASSSAATIWASDVLPRPGGPASSTWSSASLAGAGGLDEDPELVAHRLLADEVAEPARAQRAVELLVARDLGRGLDALDAGRADAAHRVALSAPAIRSSGVSPPALSSSLSASCGE